MITLDNISLQLGLGGKAFHLLVENICVPDGKIGILSGSNGSGKTTLLRIAAGSLQPKTGKVELDLPKFCFTDIERQLHHRLSISENFRYIRSLYALKKNESVNLSTALGVAGLESLDRKLLGTLSKGQKIRTIFAILYASSAATVVLDEPFNGLDAVGRDFAMRVLDDVTERGAAVLISTHDSRIFGSRQILDFHAVEQDGERSQVEGSSRGFVFRLRHSDPVASMEEKWKP